ncbi:MAG TPA: hypothetical protein PK329_00990 [Myxococcota bacterium]|nr:hypothetical protein [Myxococcota bacterium]HON25367.1 hypothetical protein [Myxococcota bacterium]HOS62894.1 hypothetical protein [Myxococcota bacterium]HPC92887.1 hypothetical protein [Myxococcota bacterium]HPL24845.1 hypothetical protein [Myxococcota bacterium]
MELCAFFKAAAFGKAGSRLSLVTALLLATWGFGCAAETCPPPKEVDVGICRAENAQVSGVQYGDRTTGEASAWVEYACAATSMEERVYTFYGEIECLDPQTPIEKWSSVDWGLYVRVKLPGKICSCDPMRDGCGFSFKLYFDRLVDVPKEGQVFDLTQATLPYNGLNISADRDYEITGGTLEFVTLKSDQYSYKIRNLTLTRDGGAYGETPPKCYNPETITVDSISIDCLPSQEIAEVL